jgi:ubiquitin-protein ligase
VAVPSSDNAFKWYFIIFGLKDTPYEGGYFLGRMDFPQNYPWAPPELLMLTKNGKYEVDIPICMNVASRFHLAEWNPIWRGT